MKSTDVDDNFKEEFKNNMIISTKNDPKFKTEFLDKGIPVVARFFGSNSILIVEFEIK